MKIMNNIRTLGCALLCVPAFWSVEAMAATLTDLNFSTAPGDVTQLELVFDSTPPEVSGYTIEKPARIALDLPGVDSALSTKRHDIGNGNARSATVVEAKDRSRLVINLNQLVGYTTAVQGNRLFVRIG